MRIGLREKLLFPVLGLFLVVSIGIGTVAVQQSVTLFRKRSAQALNMDIHTGATRIDEWFLDRKADVDAFASQEYLAAGIREPALRSSVSAHLGRILAHFPYGQSLSLLDATGTTIASSDPTRLGKSLGDRSYFREGMQGRPHISEPVLSKSTQRPVVVIGAPVEGPDGKPAGVLFLSVGLEGFTQRFLKSFAPDPNSYAFVFQLANERIVAHPDSSLILQKSLDSLEVGPLVRSAMKDEVVSAKIGGRRCQLEYAPIPTTGWGLVAVHDLQKEESLLARTRWILLGIALLGAVLASLVLVVWIVRPLLRSVREAVAFAQAVGEGDVSQTLEAHSTDEIGQLVQALSSMGESLRAKTGVAERVADRDLTVSVHVSSPRDSLGAALRKMVANLQEVLGGASRGTRESRRAAERFQLLSEGLAGAAEETSAQAKVVTDATENVHRNVQSVAAGAEEMGSSIREIARSASEAAGIAADAVERVRKTNALVGKLGESSNEIGSIIEVIQGIAGQTNLLALNATIEAARAGEAGKGFAVVAGEVKELSKATRDATESIQGRIGSIQSEMASAIESIRGIGEVIQNVNNISQSIASAVEEQTAATSEITRSIADASKGVGEIASGIQQVSLAAHSTAKAASEINADSHLLRKNAVELSDSIGTFKLD